MHVETTTTQTLKITVGNVEFRVDSDHPDDVFVSTCANAAIDTENVDELAKVATKINEFVFHLRALRGDKS